MRPSYLYIDNPCTGKTAFLYCYLNLLFYCVHSVITITKPVYKMQQVMLLVLMLSVNHIMSVQHEMFTHAKNLERLWQSSTHSLSLCMVRMSKQCTCDAVCTIFMLCCVLLCFLTDDLYPCLISFTVISLSLGQSYNWFDARERTLKYMGQLVFWGGSLTFIKYSPTVVR